MTAMGLVRTPLARLWLPRAGGAAIGAGLALATLVSPFLALLAAALLGIVTFVAQRRRAVPWLRSTASGAVAVALKELRGRMRGRRAFTVVTLYLALLAGFTWAVIQIQRPGSDTLQSYAYGFGGSSGIAQAARSAGVGQTLFAALLILLTMLVIFLAPAFTAGAISQERERQTFELLAATPLPATAVVLGKLLSALVYLFLLVVASIPLMSFVFTFGGVAVDDVIRAYVLLIATALGLGALGLFLSALVQRTGAATILSYLVVIAMTVGSLFVFLSWASLVNYQPGATVTGPNPIEALRRRPPEALVWLNPTVAVADLVCSTSSGDLAFLGCAVATYVTNTPYFGQPGQSVTDVKGGVIPPSAFGTPDGSTGIVGGAPADRSVAVNAPVNPFGVPRDLIWPRIALGEVGFAVILTLASILLVSPTRPSLRLPSLGRPTLPRRRRKAPVEVAP